MSHRAKPLSILFALSLLVLVSTTVLAVTSFVGGASIEPAESGDGIDIVGQAIVETPVNNICAEVTAGTTPSPLYVNCDEPPVLGVQGEYRCNILGDQLVTPTISYNIYAITAGGTCEGGAQEIPGPSGTNVPTAIQLMSFAASDGGPINPLGAFIMLSVFALGLLFLRHRLKIT